MGLVAEQHQKILEIIKEADNQLSHSKDSEDLITVKNYVDIARNRLADVITELSNEFEMTTE